MIKKFYQIICTQCNYSQPFSTTTFNLDDEPTEEEIEDKIVLVRNQQGKFRTDATVKTVYELA